MAAGVVGDESFEDDAARGAGLAAEVRAFFAFLRISRILRFCSILPCDAVELPDVTVSGMEEIDDFLVVPSGILMFSTVCGEFCMEKNMSLRVRCF